MIQKTPNSAIQIACHPWATASFERTNGQKLSRWNFPATAIA